ncbi:MAG: hypothetical protein RMX35_10580 [Nostoc sp. DcaGUA01]|uniref:hypothetical protein n=1 Tax=Nostoc sp. CCY 9925 TaxID=3103865 RepID=UPI002ADAD48C|nr:hypothetical protein [Nostoc sp. DcaGUA01]
MASYRAAPPNRYQASSFSSEEELVPDEKTVLFASEVRQPNGSSVDRGQLGKVQQVEAADFHGFDSVPLSGS